MSDTDQTMLLKQGEPDDYVRLSAHPRAQRAIGRSKAFGGLIGFLIGLWMGSRAGLPAWDTGVRALASGIAGYVIVWIAAVQIWRQVAIAEYRHAEKQRTEQRAIERAALAEIRRQRAEAAEAARQ
jgi:type VI protein secretion system component VasK